VDFVYINAHVRAVLCNVVKKGFDNISFRFVWKEEKFPPLNGVYETVQFMDSFSQLLQVPSHNRNRAIGFHTNMYNNSLNREGLGSFGSPSVVST
jgi:hypothetical protein